MASLNGAANSARSTYWSFYSAGSYVASGFANGIASGAYLASFAAAAMARAASVAAQRALDIHSPSKVFAWIGEMTGQGFVDSIDSYVPKVETSATKMAGSAVTGASDILDSGFDFNPTITPVMDLSKVQNGVGSMNSMISGQYGINANFNSRMAGMADSMMTKYQTRESAKYDNSDVVNAVVALGDRIDQVSAAVGSMQLSIDGKALVGQIAQPMDRSLGNSMRRNGRWI